MFNQWIIIRCVNAINMVVDITFLRSPDRVYWSVDPGEHDCWRDNPSRNSDAVDSELSRLCRPSDAPWGLSEEEFVLFVNISICSLIIMDKYSSKYNQYFTWWSPSVDVFSVQVWETLFVSDCEGGVPTRSVKRSKPPLWFPYPLRPENQTT